LSFVFMGLGLPEWLTIIGLLGGLILTFKVMARASVRYEQARRAREGVETRRPHGKDGDEARDTP
jgi:hypothetical protein